MWDGGNVAHYAPSHPRVLIDGKPARAPWIDLNDLRARGARGGVDGGRPARHAAGAAHDRRRRRGAAAVHAALPARAGEVTVGWAILLPRPSFAGGR